MRAVATSADALLAGAGSRESFSKNADSLSGSPFEHAVIDGEPYVVKHLGRGVDWLARALGDDDCFALTLWREGLLDDLPAEIDHTIVGAAYDGTTATLLMRDVGPHLLPTGSAEIPGATHLRFMDRMARMHARFWGFEDTFGLLPPHARYTALTPAMAAREAAAGHDDPVPRAIPSGWAALAKAAPEAHELTLTLATDPAPLVEALADTPATLVHGDWKAGNLGEHPDTRTILLDWGWPGRGAPLVDLAWYLAVNCDRLPISKKDTIGAYRLALAGQGIDVGDWFDRQLELALLGGFVQLGWSKTHDPVELGWWVRRIVPTARRLA